MTKANGLDPITVEVVRHKLEGVANEMQQRIALDLGGASAIAIAAHVGCDSVKTGKRQRLQLMTP